ncbi:MAG: hypothetical protein KGI41_00170 [Patescibacteria group bacterium]|nr:hypothetical protein [Patescibacteria group bacterium]MDE1965647.1 hypothetical protein [Patescibacteria group bacterium]
MHGTHFKTSVSPFAAAILLFAFMSVIMCSLPLAAAHAQPVTNGGTPNSQPVTNGGNTTLQNPLGSNSSLPNLVTTVLTALGTVGYVLVVLALVYTGFLFVAAQGKEEKIREARQALIYTVIGGLLLLGANAIYLLIQGTVTAISGG